MKIKTQTELRRATRLLARVTERAYAEINDRQEALWRLKDALQRFATEAETPEVKATALALKQRVSENFSAEVGGLIALREATTDLTSLCL